MTAQRLIVLAGLPGSGKSTLADRLSRHFSLPLFSIDPIEASAQSPEQLLAAAVGYLA